MRSLRKLSLLPSPYLLTILKKKNLIIDLCLTSSLFSPNLEYIIIVINFPRQPIIIYYYFNFSTHDHKRKL